eukprot:CAMPEP_0198198212 /NCGR_PEP_ID=MMETSP1445-20131203/1695_1 /TAXON_ID=36898 /ORGANISM="Pyramimonas sp., Strain CCMP2087" /LENGTH=49 /DNA_ID= /DNA_START= /DNA_END= /DNA_ORIENTATION=
MTHRSMPQRSMTQQSMTHCKATSLCLILYSGHSCHRSCLSMTHRSMPQR